MNKKGQIGVGTLMVAFIGILVGVIIFQTIAQQVGTTTNTIEVIGDQETAAVNGASFYLTNYRAISSFVAYNLTNGTAIASGGHIVLIDDGNYTVNNDVVYNGALAVNISVDDALYESETWNLSYTAQPLTYIANSGARSMTSLIVIFFALLVASVALAPVIQSKVLDSIGG